MGAALNFQNFRASHGRAQNFQSRDPVFGAAFLEHTIGYVNCSHARPPPPLRKPSPSLVSRFQPKYPDYHLWEKISEPLMGAAFNFQNFRASHGRAQKIAEPLMGAAVNFQIF